MISYGTYHQVSQCQWCHMEHIIKCRNINDVIRNISPSVKTSYIIKCHDVIWNISPSITMSMMSYGIYHQVSQCQWYPMEHITMCHNVNDVIWNTSPRVTMSMASGPMLTCSRPPCPGPWCPPVSTCTSSLQWLAYAGSHTTTLCHPGHQSTNKFKNSLKSFFIWLCTHTLLLHINNTVNIHVILKLYSRTCFMWLLGEITNWQYMVECFTKSTILLKKRQRKNKYLENIRMFDVYSASGGSQTKCPKMIDCLET